MSARQTGRRQSFEAYRATEAVNWSTLREMQASPARYQWRLTHPPEETAAMRLGRATHTAVFEPDRLALEYAIWEGSRRAGPEWSDFAAANAMRTILKLDEYETALAIRDAVRANRDARRLLRSGQAEVSLEWTDKATGIVCKARLDWLSPGRIVELKTTKSIDAHEWERTFAASLYHGQLAFYARGLAAQGRRRAAPSAYVIAVENTPPFEVGVFEVGEDELWAGEVIVERLLARLAECRAAGKWPGRYDGVQRLRLPAWAYPADETGPRPAIDAKGV